MTTEAQFRDRVTRSGLFDPDETAVAAVSGYRAPTHRTFPAAVASGLIAGYRASNWRVFVLTDRQLYICSMGRQGGALKSVLATYPRGTYTASMTDGGSVTVEEETIFCHGFPESWMRPYAEKIVAAGRSGT
jgi:hypothetical protein